jgi:DNA-directed RNA polymerase subunit RPC12/RpoP
VHARPPPSAPAEQTYTRRARQLINVGHEHKRSRRDVRVEQASHRLPVRELVIERWRACRRCGHKVVYKLVRESRKPRLVHVRGKDRALWQAGERVLGLRR